MVFRVGRAGTRYSRGGRAWSPGVARRRCQGAASVRVCGGPEVGRRRLWIDRFPGDPDCPACAQGRRRRPEDGGDARGCWAGWRPGAGGRGSAGSNECGTPGMWQSGRRISSSFGMAASSAVISGSCSRQVIRAPPALAPGASGSSHAKRVGKRNGRAPMPGQSARSVLDGGAHGARLGQVGRPAPGPPHGSRPPRRPAKTPPSGSPDPAPGNAGDPVRRPGRAAMLGQRAGPMDRRSRRDRRRQRWPSMTW